MTNAHVVAGESDTVVQIDGRAPGVPASVVVYDPHDDIAVLRVQSTTPRALVMEADPKSGTAAAILGYPLDGPFDAEAGRLGQTQRVSTDDAYGNGPVIRSITSLRGRVRPGNSGGPMVDAAGRVLATVFAAITGAGSGHGGFAVPNALVRQAVSLAQSRSAPVSTRAARSRCSLASGTAFSGDGTGRPGRRRPGGHTRPVFSACDARSPMPGRPRNPVQATPWADGGLQHRPPLGVCLVPPDVLGHLMHRFQL